MRTLTHTIAFALGVAVGVGGTLGPTRAAESAPARYPGEERACPSGAIGLGPSPDTRADEGSVALGSPARVARPATAAQARSGSDVVLPITSPVTAGDTLILSVMLTATCPGRVEATDTEGDTFRIVDDVTDSRRHRTMILASFHVRALGTADSIHLTYPHAGKYRIAVDDFRDIGTATTYAAPVFAPEWRTLPTIRTQVDRRPVIRRALTAVIA
ncbi:hypothetical protein [Embleya sp. AB8]|uniref:hypothetical protein n=1 Tax=Embleya sp. AB8 TaxID=3156304 RepID=UPI003C72F32A